MGFVFFFIKVMGAVFQKHLCFNDRFFHCWFWWFWIVRFDEISCNIVVVCDGLGGEEVLLLVVLCKVD